MQQSFIPPDFAHSLALCYKTRRLAPDRTSVRQEKVMKKKEVTCHRWDDIPKEIVTELLDRRLITGERMMPSAPYS